MDRGFTNPVMSPGLTVKKALRAYQPSETITDTFYYAFAGSMVAIRQDGVLSYSVGDDLGSTSATYNTAMITVSQQWHEPFGEIRHQTGALPTDIGFTGQRLDAESGLMFYTPATTTPQ